MTTGEKIKLLRERNNYTLEELGKKIGVGKSTVRKWETGMIANMRRDNIAKLAEVFGVSPTYLISDDFKDSSTNNDEEPKNTYSMLSDEDKSVLDWYHSQSEETKRLILSFPNAQGKKS